MARCPSTRREVVCAGSPFRAERTPGDAELALRLAGARYHLVEGAGAVDDLRAAMRGLHSFIERKYGWSARHRLATPNATGRSLLLELYLEEPGLPGVEYTFAKLLKGNEVHPAI